MFSIYLYQNLSENNRMDKNLNPPVTFQGSLKENTSVIDPVITIESPVNVVCLYNYLFIPDFNRYYFITNVIAITDTLTQINLHVDVLMSFKDYIRSNLATTRRQENDWNLYLNDGSFRTYQYKTVGTYKFSNGFPKDNDLVMAIAGRSNID